MNNENDHNADTVLIIQTTIVRRANRESLWDMPLKEVDLRTMAEEVAESLQLIDGLGR